jgi:hypothetical protein
MHTIKQLGLLPLAITILLGCRPATPPVSPTPVAAAATGTVTIEIDLGENSETIEIHNVEKGTTLESVMRSIDQVPITIHGSGVTAFVDQIGDTATGGSGGWTFKVNGELANQGIGSIELSPPITVTWAYSETGEIAED